MRHPGPFKWHDLISFLDALHRSVPLQLSDHACNSANPAVFGEAGIGQVWQKAIVHAAGIARVQAGLFLSGIARCVLYVEALLVLRGQQGLCGCYKTCLPLMPQYAVVFQATPHTTNCLQRWWFGEGIALPRWFAPVV